MNAISAADSTQNYSSDEAALRQRFADVPCFILGPEGMEPVGNNAAPPSKRTAQMLAMKVAEASLLKPTRNRSFGSFLRQSGMPGISISGAGHHLYRAFPLSNQNGETRFFVALPPPSAMPELMQDMVRLSELLKEEYDAMKKSHDSLQVKAERDQLTGLYNRHAAERLFEAMSNQIRRGNENSSNNKFLALTIVDMDKLKDINDTYGHDAGDKAIIHMAQSLKRLTRSEDEVIRFGGEEMIILSIVESPESGERFIDRVREGLANTAFSYDNVPIPITASFGITVINPSDVKATITDLTKMADEGLYKAKKSGRNKVVYSPYSPAIEAQPKAQAPNKPAKTERLSQKPNYSYT